MTWPIWVAWQGISDDRHQLEIGRGAARLFVRELETRSTLLHDFVHFAVELEAGLEGGFYGRVAHGRIGKPGTTALAEVEMVVGAFQSALKTEVDAELFVRRLASYVHGVGQTVPRWLSADLIRRAETRYRGLVGQWKATPFGAPMTVRFSPRP